MTETLLWAALILASILGVLLALIRMPGTWLILAAAALHSWKLDWARPPTTILLVLLALALVAEIVEFAASAVTIQRAGAKRRTSVAAVVGGLVGMIVFTIPLPIIGTILGGLLGCFIAATLVEATLTKDAVHGARVGVLAAVGQGLGMIAKFAFAITMAGATVIAAYPNG